LKDLLGDAIFRKSIQAFVERWHGRHPIPWDLFNTVNDVTGRDLNWFWNRWYFSNGYMDLAVTGVAKTGSGYSTTLDNIGGMPVPVDLVIQFSDGSTSIMHETPALWAPDQRKAAVAIPTRKSIKSVALKAGIWIDADTTNNRWVLR